MTVTWARLGAALVHARAVHRARHIRLCVVGGGGSDRTELGNVKPHEVHPVERG